MPQLEVPDKYFEKPVEPGKTYTYKGPCLSISYKCNTDICEYCYARSQRMDKDMSVEDFTKVLKWLKEISDTREIFLVGGEPTIIKNLKEYLDAAKKEEFEVNIYTNGGFKEEVRNLLITHPSVMEVIFHYEPRFFKIISKENYLKNIEEISKKKKVMMLYTTSDPNFDYSEVLDWAKKYKMLIRWIFATPTKGNTPYLSLAEMKKSRKHLQKFLLEALENGVETIPDLSFPLCVFDKEFVEKYYKKLNLVKMCFPFAYIKPTLGTQFCSSVPEFIHEPVKDSKELLKIIDNYKAERKKMDKIYAFKECKTCEWNNVYCQGGCLCYRLYGKEASKK